MGRTLLVALLVGMSSLPSMPARRPLASSLTASTVLYGVRLSLTLSRRVYPQDALVHVIVQVKNVTHKSVQIGGTGGAVCRQWGPGVRVGNAAGQAVYPPAITWMLASCGPPIRLRPLAPGQAVRRQLFAILWGNHIQAVASVGRELVEIATPPLTVSLRPEPAPHLSLRTTSPSEIDVAPATPTQHGRFYYITSQVCFFPTPGAQGSSGSGWGIGHFERGTPDTDGTFHMRSGCEPPSRWSFAGGWLDHPVAVINYVQSYSR